MYCDKCDVTIPYKTDTCPLCFNRISEETELDNPVYPRRNASFRFPIKYSFTLFYSVIAIVAFFVVLTINLLTDMSVLWALIVGASLLYFYILIRHTIMTSTGSAGKIFVHGVLLSVLLVVIQNTTHTGAWAYEYVVPFVLLANTVLLWAFSLIRRIRRANYAFTLIGISIFNLVPLYWYIFSYSSVLWTSIMSASIAFSTIILVILVFGKLFIEEIKRLFHI